MPAITISSKTIARCPVQMLFAPETAFWTASQACFLREAILDDDMNGQNRHLP